MAQPYHQTTRQSGVSGVATPRNAKLDEATSLALFEPAMILHEVGETSRAACSFPSTSQIAQSVELLSARYRHAVDVVRDTAVFSDDEMVTFLPRLPDDVDLLTLFVAASGGYEWLRAKVGKSGS